MNQNYLKTDNSWNRADSTDQGQSPWWYILVVLTRFRFLFNFWFLFSERSVCYYLKFLCLVRLPGKCLHKAVVTHITLVQRNSLVVGRFGKSGQSYCIISNSQTGNGVRLVRFKLRCFCEKGYGFFKFAGIKKCKTEIIAAGIGKRILLNGILLDLDTAFNCSLNAAFFIRLFAGINGRFYSLHSSHSKS